MVSVSCFFNQIHQRFEDRNIISLDVGSVVAGWLESDEKDRIDFEHLVCRKLGSLFVDV